MSTSRTYRLGDRGHAVAEIRAKLTALDLLQDDPALALAGAPGAEFTGEVDRAVRAFQQSRGITVDGIVGPLTYRALEEARWRLGDRILLYVPTHMLGGDDVATLQQRLLEMGFDCGRVDGIFGTETEQALREFQRNVGLPADGTCGPTTLKALTALSRTVVGGAPHAMRESEAIHRAGPTLTGKLVIVDPGHGPDSSGVTGNGLDESPVVYDIASRVEGRIAATGGLAFLTRGPDGGLDEVERAHFANAAGADLVISLHLDAHTSPHASGVATYFYGNDRYGHHSSVGQRFAELVQAEIVTRTDLRDCRIHAKTWDLLRRTRMPCVRIEAGYLTNPGDAARLADPDFRDTLAEAIVAAVARLYLPADLDTGVGTLRVPESTAIR